MKSNRVYRVIDGVNGREVRVTAKSVAHAAALGRRAIAHQCRERFIPWRSDSSTGGWHGISIDMPGQNVVRVQKPTPRPERSDLPWKKQLAVAA